MQKVLEWAESEKIPYHDMTPMQFADFMNKRLETETSPFADVEDTAAKWLEVIDDCGFAAGH